MKTYILFLSTGNWIVEIEVKACDLYNAEAFGRYTYGTALHNVEEKETSDGR